MSIFQAVVLGIVQGLTELLPVSSSAHLNIIPWLLNWNSSDEFVKAFEGFDVALHVGTLLAIVMFFFKDWLTLITSGVKRVFKKDDSFEGKMFWYLVLATLPGGIIGFVLDKYFEDVLTKPVIIASALAVMGVILYFVDKYAKSEVTYEKMGLKETFLIGLSQALAFIPGVSRSGVTMTTARLMKVDRTSAAKYSFLLSTPIVFGAAIFKFKDFVFSVPFVIGVLTSFVVGLIVIKFLLSYLKKGSFKVFAIYRILFAALIFVKLFILK